MSGTALNELSACEVAGLVARREASCEEVARACLARIEARESVVRAWAFLDPDLVLRQARALDAGPVRGPLHGVPLGVKDVLDTFDMPTQMGSPIYRGHRPAADAACVALARASGALVLGKTVTCEFAGVTPGSTTHPLDPDYTPGGSSSGSAAAVADHMAALAFGTQTGGSMLRPASFCGVIGYKPSFGLVNRAGLKFAAESLDTIGIFARAVEDLDLTMRALTGRSPVRWLAPDAKLRIGLCRTNLWELAEPATREAVEDAAARLGRNGAEVRDVTLPEFFSDLQKCREVINDFERARAMAHEWNHHAEQISEGLARSIRNGSSMPQERFTEALTSVARCRAALGEVFDGLDVLLAPTVPGEAPRGLGWTGDHRFQSIWTLLHVPSLTLPTHAGPHGMPVGIQLVAPAHADAHLLACARLVFDRLGRAPTRKPAQPAPRTSVPA
ncbi:MAG TPA: amidase [Xanthobacteraceae bacterium]|jgi:amidase|nr:amidase [Xanthobacteraceae bacterium]